MGERGGCGVRRVICPRFAVVRAHTRWPSDYLIRDLDAAGPPAASYVRLKIFTLENTLLIRRSGSLSPLDIEGFEATLRPVLT